MSTIAPVGTELLQLPRQLAKNNNHQWFQRNEHWALSLALQATKPLAAN